MTAARKTGLLLFVLSNMLTSACTTPISTARPAPYCQHWDVDGTWSIDQSNGFSITFILKHQQDELTGTADNGSGPVPLVGTMRGNQLALTVSWASGGAGRYIGTMSPSGQLTNGLTQNLSNLSSTATWSTTAQFKCLGRSHDAQ
jgi:hypothetical protein